MTVEELQVVGWVLSEPVTPPIYMGEAVGPSLRTISDCIQSDLPRPDPWLGDWYQDREDADRAATSLGRPDVQVIAVAMSQSDADHFMAQWGESPTPWFDLLRRREPLASTARVLGYEIVGARSPWTSILGIAMDTRTM
jgi:hypothetical protein